MSGVSLYQCPEQACVAMTVPSVSRMGFCKATPGLWVSVVQPPAEGVDTGAAGTVGVNCWAACDSSLSSCCSSCGCCW